MDGVTDRTMRELMGEVGGFTHMVTEFLRVSRMALPAKVIRRHMAETSTRSRTSHGIPVSLQLLGGHAGRLAETALTAVEVGVRGIDLNFGCPAPTVNRHDGGASLLRYPERIREIVTEVRRAVPRDIPVSVKMRLGWDDPTTLLRNAAEAIEGGASSIAIHGRTKAQGYAPPALWEPIGEVRKHSPIPIVANGDIWTFEDFLRCRDETGCRHFMLGRSALADPHLAGRIGRHLGLASDDRPFPSDHEWRHLLTRFSELQESPNRLKQ
ncbi:MAG: tRNA-dihydrouridine synthase family protein, partial [Bdellovibrionales bacterium]|nr:tRNA-dihydrouridine synthase family protein [Bdellovibrionales bacterium]